jgi:hypothetical protein
MVTAYSSMKEKAIFSEAGQLTFKYKQQYVPQEVRLLS